jgi:hypothetical protein
MSWVEFEEKASMLPLVVGRYQGCVQDIGLVQLDYVRPVTIAHTRKLLVSRSNFSDGSAALCSIQYCGDSQSPLLLS